MNTAKCNSEPPLLCLRLSHVMLCFALLPCRDVVFMSIIDLSGLPQFPLTDISGSFKLIDAYEAHGHREAIKRYFQICCLEEHKIDRIATFGRIGMIITF